MALQTTIEDLLSQGWHQFREQPTKHWMFAAVELLDRMDQSDVFVLFDKGEHTESARYGAQFFERYKGDLSNAYASIEMRDSTVSQGRSDFLGQFVDTEVAEFVGFAISKLGDQYITTYFSHK